MVLEVVRGSLHDACTLLVEHLVTLVFTYQVHLVNENEDFGTLREVSKSIEAVDVVIEVDLELLGCDIEDKNEHSHVLEDMVTLRLKVLLHEAVLTTTIPKREHKIAQEAHSLLVDVYCECYFVSVSRQVVGENDRPHRGFTGSHSAHKEDLSDVLLFRVASGDRTALRSCLLLGHF